jgi:short-subunit dehydrogenase
MHLSDDGRLSGRVAIVTGASSGVGRAIAIALSHQGVQLCLIGRDPVSLAETRATLEQHTNVSSFEIDLRDEKKFPLLSSHLDARAQNLDFLIHCAGTIHQSTMEYARIEDFDRQYATNVRAPYLLTQHLMPWIKKASGQIVFINSSVGLTAKRPEIGQYAATKHALKAIADSLREEVNPSGIRVLTLYLGRTATPMQAKLCVQDKREYHPEKLLQPEDVASMVVHSLMLPRTAEVTEISLRPMIKEHCDLT